MHYVKKATAVSYSISEIGKQLAWLSGALRTCPIDVGIICCTPNVGDALLDQNSLETSEVTKSQISCRICLKVEEDSERAECYTGQCLHNVFSNPFVVKGLPILRRPKCHIGLEIPHEFYVSSSASAIRDTI